MMEKRSFKERLRNDYIGKVLVTFCALLIIAITFAIIFFITRKGITTFLKGNASVIELES